MDFSAKITHAYGLATSSMHDGGRVEIHIGSDVLEWLRKNAEHKVANWVQPVSPTLWGFPLVPTTASPDHVSVHVVHTVA